MSQQQQLVVSQAKAAAAATMVNVSTKTIPLRTRFPPMQPPPPLRQVPLQLNPIYSVGSGGAGTTGTTGTTAAGIINKPQGNGNDVSTNDDIDIVNHDTAGRGGGLRARVSTRKQASNSLQCPGCGKQYRSKSWFNFHVNQMCKRAVRLQSSSSSSSATATATATAPTTTPIAIGNGGINPTSLQVGLVKMKNEPNDDLFMIPAGGGGDQEPGSVLVSGRSSWMGPQQQQNSSSASAYRQLANGFLFLEHMCSKPVDQLSDKGLQEIDLEFDGLKCLVNNLPPTGPSATQWKERLFSVWDKKNKLMLQHDLSRNGNDGSDRSGSSGSSSNYN